MGNLSINDYDLENLVRITTKRFGFDLFTTPQYQWKFTDIVFEEMTALLIRQNAKGVDTFIDIGAHNGFYSVLAGLSNPDCQLLAFEPVPENAEIVKKNLLLNNLKASVNNVAVSDFAGSASFQISEATSQSGFIANPDKAVIKEIEVDVIPIDHFIDQIPDGPVLVKMDTEGSESKVLRGMEKLIKKVDDLRLVIEVNPVCLEANGYSPSSLLNQIDQMGFDIFVVFDMEMMYVKYIPGTDWNEYMGERTYRNIFCVKKERAVNLCAFNHSGVVGGGAELSLLELLDKLVAEKAVIGTVILPADGPIKHRLQDMGLAVWVTNYHWWCDYQMPNDQSIVDNLMATSYENIEKIIPVLEKISPDLILTNTLVIPWGAFAAHKLNCPHIWWVKEFGQLDHGLEFFYTFSRSIQIIKQSANHVLVNSLAVKNALFADLDADKCKAVVNNVTLKKDAISNDVYFHHPGSLRIALLGRVTTAKGQEDAIFAVMNLIAMGHNVEMSIVGSAQSGVGQSLQKIVKNEKVSDRIHFVETVENVQPILEQANLGLVCSKNEAFGRVTVEAMLMGLPVIGTNTGGTVELIDEGISGLLYAPGDANELAEKIMFFISNPEKLEEFGKQAHERIQKKLASQPADDEIYRLSVKLKSRKNMQSVLLSSLAIELSQILRQKQEGDILYKENMIGQMNVQLTEKEQAVQTLAGQVSEKEQVVQSLINQVAEKEQVVQSLAGQVSEKEQVVQSLASQVAEKDEMLQSLSTQISEKERFCLACSAQVAEDKQAAQTLFGQMAEEEKIIQSLSEQVAKSKEFSDLLQKQLEDNKSKVSALSMENVDLNHQLGKLNQYINAREQILQDLNTKLLEIYSSRAWKFIQMMWRVRLSLLPNESKRLFFLKKVLSLFKPRQKSQLHETKKVVELEKIELDNQPKEHKDTEEPYRFAYSSTLENARGKKGSEYVAESEMDLSREEHLVKLLAFYLPQFHPIPENDAWWGKGFTEWTNVTKAVPQFVGHYQPHLPGELGFYDLRVPQVQRRQVELAKKYGIFGFCFYHYWFDGKRLLEHPLNQFINDDEIDFPFCICWANENWSRRWDGLDSEILIAQNHCPDTDYRFIQDILPYIKHRNYIHIDNRPLILVYRGTALADPLETTKKWRKYAVEAGIGDPYLVVAQVFGFRDDPRTIGFDAAVEFPPNTMPAENIADRFSHLNPDFQGRIYDYVDVAKAMSSRMVDYKLFKTVMPSWDNTPRRPDAASIFVNSSPEQYKEWLQSTIEYTLEHISPSNRFIFINAWNEWAEGACLEPDQKYGYAYLQATSDTLQKYIIEQATDNISNAAGDPLAGFVRQSDTAIIVHVYYPELWDEIWSYLSVLGNSFDLFVTVPETVELSDEMLLRDCERIHILRFPNRGRDIAPFLKVFTSICSKGYKYGLKLHTKRSLHRGDGAQWRQDMLKKLVGSKNIIQKAKTTFDKNAEIGIIAPKGHVLPSTVYWGKNERNVKKLAKWANIQFDGKVFSFAAGSMFWFNPSALSPLALLKISQFDFDAEKGQVDGTLAHALERFFGLLMAYYGYQIADIDVDGTITTPYLNEAMNYPFAKPSLLSNGEN